MGKSSVALKATKVAKKAKPAKAVKAAPKVKAVKKAVKLAVKSVKAKTVKASVVARPKPVISKVPAVVSKPVTAQSVIKQPKVTAPANQDSSKGDIRALPAKKVPVVKIKPFHAGDYVVYPAHGLGRVIGVNELEVAGEKHRFIVINFEKENMTLRVLSSRTDQVRLRHIASQEQMRGALQCLKKAKVRIRKVMWSRRAQEYEAKINSGDPIAVAEVVRELYRGEQAIEQSYSERQIYQAALVRLAREYAAVEKIAEDLAIKKLEGMIKAA